MKMSMRLPAMAATASLAGLLFACGSDSLEPTADESNSVQEPAAIQERCITLPRGFEICFGPPDDTPTPAPTPEPTPTPDPTPTPPPTPTPCPADAQVWHTDITVTLNATTESPIYPDLNGTAYITTDADVDRDRCEETWDVYTAGQTDIYGAPVDYILTGSGTLPNTNGTATLMSDLSIQVASENCTFDLSHIALTGSYTAMTDYVSLSGQETLLNIRACGALWNVDATIVMEGDLE